MKDDLWGRVRGLGSKTWRGHGSGKVAVSVPSEHVSLVWLNSFTNQRTIRRIWHELNHVMLAYRSGNVNKPL